MTVLSVEGTDKQAFIYSDEEFVRLVEERMGCDATAYLRDMMQRVNEYGENARETWREIVCEAVYSGTDEIADLVVKRLEKKGII